MSYPFTLTRHNLAPNGATESETYFEGFVQYFEDSDTLESYWDVTAYVTGFTQYQGGRVVAKVDGLKSDKWQVDNLKDFEDACIEAATDQFKLKAA